MQAHTAGDVLHAPRSAAAIWKSPALRKAVKIAMSFALFLLFWEGACRVFAIPEFALPAPSVILDILVERHELFWRHSLVTFYETIAGFAIAVVFGVIAAAVIVMVPSLADIIMPILLISQLVPKVAIAPLLLIWFGYGLTPKIFIAFLIAFFPIVVNTASGLAAVEKPLLDLARSLEATRFQIFRKLRLPSALPELFSGMKIAMTLAVIGAIIGEFVGGSAGLGYLIIVANSELNTPLAFAALLLLSAGGIALYALVEAAERFFVPWNRPASDAARLGGG
jgi:NitT/TauT family transport system permease protein